MVVIQRWERQGVRVNDPNAPRLLAIDSPSHQNLVDGIADIKASIAGSRKDQEYRRAQDAMKAGDPVLPMHKGPWKVISDALKLRKSQQKVMEDFLDSGNYLLGRVFAASGLRTVQSSDDSNWLSIRNWALVQLTPKRAAGTNAVSLLPSCLHYLTDR